ncbi:hypothetical protein ES703_93072 [subsurface metagenome]
MKNNTTAPITMSHHFIQPRPPLLPGCFAGGLLSRAHILSRSLKKDMLLTPNYQLLLQYNTETGLVKRNNSEFINATASEPSSPASLILGLLSLWHRLSLIPDRLDYNYR